MLKFSFRFFRKAPIVIYGNSNVTIKKSAQVIINGRLRLGHSKKQAQISAQKVNIYFADNSKITIEDGVSVGQGVNLIAKNSAQIIIGANTYFTSDSHIEAVNLIRIGKDCAISWGVTIIDSDHHSILLNDKMTSPNATVEIGDHVWIGCNVTILKNSKIGNNCIVAAGSIVKGQFPDNCLIGGSPASIIKPNANWK